MRPEVQIRHAVRSGDQTDWSEWRSAGADCDRMTTRRCNITGLDRATTYEARIRLNCAQASLGSDWTYTTRNLTTFEGEQLVSGTLRVDRNGTNGTRRLQEAHRWNRNPRPQPQKLSKLVSLIEFC